MTMYYMAIVLPQELNQQILEFKNYMLEKYNCQVGLKSPAHITIVPPFWMNDELESSLLSDADALAHSIEDFDITTDNFSAFKPRTIFIDVAANEKLGAVKKTADAYFKTRLHYKMKFENRPFHPHITIATRDLQKPAFTEAWHHFQQQEFKNAFRATGLSTLRHNKKNWDVIHTSQFKNIEKAF